MKVYVEVTELCDITEENAPAGNITQTLGKNESITYFINFLYIVILANKSKALFYFCIHGTLSMTKLESDTYKVHIPNCIQRS